MKKSQAWHHTRAGALAMWLGSIQLAVPVLVLVALALALGTYLESVHGAKVARGAVYGSWWFIGLMGLVCVSLVFAVVSRYPWKRRHVGFMVVHASLIAMIVGGFWSLFGRIEGHLALEEGRSADAIETQDELLELVEHQAGQFRTAAAAPAPQHAATLPLAQVRVQVLERWENSRDEDFVADGGPEPFRAIEVQHQPGAQPLWVGQEDKAGGPSLLGGLRIRVLADGAGWEPPAKPESFDPTGFAFIVADRRIPLADEGNEALPGWTITSVRRFARALVSGGGLTEGQTGPENPAVDVMITDGQGTIERHTAFVKFPDMVMGRTVQGAAHSGARLVAGAASGEPETLVVFGPAGAVRLGYIAADGTGRELEGTAALPSTVDVGLRRVTLVRQFTRATGGTRTVRAPAAGENRPALVLRVGDSTELTIVPWKGMAGAGADGGNLMLRYGPRSVRLPFSVKLTDFRKMDYPGTDMAMAYESDVAIARPGAAESTYRIFMNHPYAQGPWRVYQSGFVGDSLSIFSVMRDPGLPLTYIGAAGLCLGIVLTFFSRSFSWGHPGIPVAFAAVPNQEKAHAAPSLDPVVTARLAPARELAGAGRV